MPIERAPELEEMAKRFTALVRKKDFATAREMLSTDESFLAIGTDGSEIWRTREELMPEFEQMAESAETGELDGDDGEMRGYRQGDVGWIVGLDGGFKLSDGGRIPSRTVVICHRQAGDWKMVFSMASIPVPNSALDDPSSTLSRELAAQSVPAH
jgi:SnoaL-like domain